MAPEDFLDLRREIPDAVFDIRYATAQNFSGRPIYPAPHAYLIRAAAKSLRLVADALRPDGYRLLIWDAYRPLSATKILWDHVRDERYAAPPWRGSRHNRGAAVDLSLSDLAGRPLDMGTDFDDFGPLAHRAAPGISPIARENRRILTDAMTKHGFHGLETEWWHFDLADFARYPIRDGWPKPVAR